MNPELLLDLVNVRMPFGKYKDVLICNIPEYYLVWYHQKGFPAGKIGQLLSTMYEIKLNGLEYLLEPLKKTGSGFKYPTKK
jgi:uncharacterized protein (DUF3820 family)